MTMTDEEELELFYDLLAKFQNDLKPFENLRDLRSYLEKPENDLRNRIIEKIVEIHP